MAKRREDSFLGIHFDFHASPDEIVAREFCPESFIKMLDSVKPDYLQFDTKGHFGISSYPTKAGTQAKSIEVDVLKFLREETSKRGIALYGHHSGLYDMCVAAKHPDWAVILPDGAVSDSYISPFSPYVDEVLLPQLKELALDYKLDGAWIDGECWGAMVDYSENAKNAFKRRYHKEPPMPEGDDYEFYREFCRQGFRDYIEHYVTEIKKVQPDFRITSNWIYSPYMTEKKTVEVDFLSGDYSCSNAVISGRLCGRYLAARNMPWDLMSWGQYAIPCSWQTENRNTKEENQYKQEAATIVAAGGGYQFFNIAYCGGGYIQEWPLHIWESTAKFCRERELCHKSMPVSNVAVMVPYSVTDKSMNNLYATWSCASLDAFNTWLSALCDIQLSPNVIFESDLSTDLSSYEVIVIPYCCSMTHDDLAVLENYIKNGGKLILDINAVDSFSHITSISTESSQRELRYLSDGSALSAFEAKILKNSFDSESFGELYTKNYFVLDSISSPAAYIKNNVYSLAFDFTEVYSHNRTSTVRSWLKQLLHHADISCPVKVEGSGYVDVITTRKDNDLFINLINMTGDHRLSGVRSYNEIIPLYNLSVSAKNASQAYLEPEHTILTSQKSGDRSVFTVDRLDIHSILVIKNYFS